MVRSEFCILLWGLGALPQKMIYISDVVSCILVSYGITEASAGPFAEENGSFVPKGYF